MDDEINWIKSCINFSMLRDNATECEKIQGHNAEIQLEQLTARVKELEAEANHWRQHSYTQESTMATLEQQLEDKNKKYELLYEAGLEDLKDYKNKCAALEQQIQQAEKRWYDIGCEEGYRAGDNCDHYKSYEEMKSERDGEKKE